MNDSIKILLMIVNADDATEDRTQWRRWQFGIISFKQIESNISVKNQIKCTLPVAIR